MGVRQAAAVLALGAALTACGNSPGPDLPPAAAAQVLSTPTPTAFTDVPYDHYEEAALQTGIAPSAVVAEAGFSAGLADLCDNSPDEYTALADRMRTDASASEDPTNTLDQGLDEVDLRVGLACRARMADWMTARRTAQPESAQLDSSQSEGTGQFAETGSNYPSVDPAATASAADDSDDLTYEDHEAGYTEESGVPDSADPEPSATGTGSARPEPDGSSPGPGGDTADDAEGGDSATADPDSDSGTGEPSAETLAD